jgi:hypothetical protein
MPTVWFPNLLFEEELTTNRRPSATARHVAAGLAPVMAWLSLEQPDEPAAIIVDPDFRPVAMPESISHVHVATTAERNSVCDTAGRFEPWGWSPRAAQLAMSLSPATPHPDPDTVRFVNSREFLAPFDVSWPLSDVSESQSFSSLCRTATEVQLVLQRRFADPAARWTIKAGQSHAARNRLLGSGAALTGAQADWIGRQLVHTGPVMVEPWVTRIAECGLQFDVPPTAAGPPRFLGIVPMLTDPLGQYRGSLLPDPDSTSADTARWSPAIAHGLTIATAARERGYFGPLGIDCMLWRRDDGSICLRPSHDVNARYTMGRIALAMRRLLSPGESGAWLHLSPSDLAALPAGLARACPDGCRILRTSPERVGGRVPQLTTGLVVTRGPFPPPGLTAAGC